MGELAKLKQHHAVPISSSPAAVPGGEQPPSAGQLMMMQQMVNNDMLEKCEYVWCIMIDFLHAFDVVDHATLLGKVFKLKTTRVYQ